MGKKSRSEAKLQTNNNKLQKLINPTEITQQRKEHLTTQISQYESMNSAARKPLIFNTNDEYGTNRNYIENKKNAEHAEAV